MQIQDFFTLPDGRQAKLYTLTGKNGMTVEVSDFGGIIRSVKVPDITGQITDVVLGYADPADHITSGTYFGAMVGRVANRLKNAEFELDGKKYTTVANDNGNSLHGGLGYSHRLWQAAEYSDSTVLLELFSPDGDAGYPGNLQVKVRYTVTDDNALDIEMHGISDAPTFVNMTNHSYFNLSGESSGSILDHQLMIAADSYQETDAELIPTGRLIDVTGTAYDLRHFAEFSQIIQLLPAGLDTSFVCAGTAGELHHIAAARSRTTGIRMDVYTTDYAVQCYTSGMMGDSETGKNGKPYPRFAGFCMETQHLIDAPHNPHFPTMRINAGEEYYQKARYKFSTEKF